MNWTDWKPIPAPENCRNIQGPEGPGAYQVRNKKTNQFIQFGESGTCRNRLKSLFPKPYGVGTRNNEDKRRYIIQNWRDLEYRTISVATKADAVAIDRMLKAQNNHLFNT